MPVYGLVGWIIAQPEARVSTPSNQDILVKVLIAGPATV
jgi:hypothetical protein